MENKLYVGNLSYATTEDELNTLFSNAGTVTSVAVIKDRETGRSKGFAFVEMSSQAEAEKVINQYNGYTMGDRDLRISIARPKEEGRRGDFGGGGQRRGGFGQRGGGGGFGGNQGGPRDRNRNSRGSSGTQRY
ncbi:MAG: RNA-binding protein [Chloroflexi bacterium HGW-Chloroflexi-2]|jgi:RNA recognition motif-containing protein|nr:MAG: RNA-binding protein [Chloroflexi bacterium HGW-Chloroflexi-2]